jgi:hypothetical protein
VGKLITEEEGVSIYDRPVLRIASTVPGVRARESREPSTKFDSKGAMWRSCWCLEGEILIQNPQHGTGLNDREHRGEHVQNPLDNRNECKP